MRKVEAKKESLGGVGVDETQHFIGDAEPQAGLN